MEDQIHNKLKSIGFPEVDNINFDQVIDEGPKSIQYTKIVEWITKELQLLYSLDEHVNAIASDADSSLFLMEISSFLKEIGCQYSLIMEGHVNERFVPKSNRILLLNYLITELKSARMIQANKPDTALQVTLQESSTATDLKNMLITLRFPKPPANIPSSVLFKKVYDKLKEINVKQILPKPLFTSKLSDKQWHILTSFYEELLNEYRVRREMLLKRLDVTVQSFEWSDRLKNKSSEIKNSFVQNRNSLEITPNVKLSDILAARADLAILEKTSSASVRLKTRSDINKFLIGKVPDRGGRPYEQEPPPREMPSWQNRSTGNNAGQTNFQNRGGKTNEPPGRYQPNLQNQSGGNFGNQPNNFRDRNYEQGSSGRETSNWQNRSVGYNMGNQLDSNFRERSGGKPYEHDRREMSNWQNRSFGNNSGNRTNNSRDYNRGKNFNDGSNFQQNDRNRSYNSGARYHN